MKFHFEDQPHQANAIHSVTDLFDGTLHAGPGLVGQAPGAEGHGNFRLDRDALSERLAEVSAREPGVDEQTSLELLEVDEDLLNEAREFPNFSVEMETGTGKTYVYIATALQLAQIHGLRKFVILVHSVAIRAGVIKTFEQTKDHFRAKFPSLPYRWGVLGEGPALDDFLEPSSTVQFLVVSVQGIDKPTTGIIYQEAEQPQLWEDAGTGMNSISKTHPVVIVDEPQNFKTPLRKKALATLNPLVALRYSATHAEKFNLVHRLGPKTAKELGLVKRATVKGIAPGQTGKPYVRIDRLRSRKKQLFAEAMIDVDSSTGPRRTPVVLQNGLDLHEASNGLDQYQGMVVEHFDRKPDRVIFENGLELRVGEETGIDRLALWQDQIRHTIRAHLKRQAEIDSSGHEVKVLSLFFVERVADYWPADGNESPVLPDIFDQIYREEWERAGNDPTQCVDPAELRVHYFPSTKTGLLKDANGTSKDAQEQQARAYEEIVANKELILTSTNPRAFIFSHSALKEGWDNPNVFQVGFLRHSGSEIERRQQIGRGLRLPVDEQGRRVTDPSVCRLTLVVDETFSEFRDGLNDEYRAFGSDQGSDPDDADTSVVVKRREDKLSSPEFAELWRRIRYKARYRVSVDPDALPAKIAASAQLNEIDYLAKRTNIVQSADLSYDDEGKVTTGDNEVAETAGTAVTIVGERLPDLVRLVEDQLLASKFPLSLTRMTVANIISEVPENYKSRAIDDPESWARIVASAIRTTTIEEMVDHISFEPDPEENWWDADMVFLKSEEFNPPVAQPGSDPMYGVVEAPEHGVNLFDHVIYDSHVEREFASLLENSAETVKVFAKLPRRFKIRTPVGEYSPDWALVADEDGKDVLYLIRETKATTNLADLRWDEAMRIRFAQRHFDASPNGDVDFTFTSADAGIRIDQK